MATFEDWVAAPADEDLRRSFADPDLDDDGWEPVRVPGHWRDVAAFADLDGPLLHRTRFSSSPGPPGRRWWLRFEGIFHQGDVFLDGAYLGDTEGYFVAHEFEVTEQLGARDEHLLAVEVTGPPPPDRSRPRTTAAAFQPGEPAWNPGGLWRPAHLEHSGPVRIRHLTTRCVEASAQRAVLAFSAELDAAGPVDAHLRTTVGAVDHGTDRTLAAGSNAVEWTVTVEHPQLWWPHALGDAHLEAVAVEVRVRDQAGSHVSDRRRFRTGLRSVHLRRWVLSVNGEQLFVKGLELAPTRVALGEAPPAELVADVDRARTSGFDLVRVHGHVARPETYDAADRAGMLVWQDFPLARSPTRSMRWQAQRQALEMVRALAHHPSVATWWAPDRSVRRWLDKADGTRPVLRPSAVPGLPASAGSGHGPGRGDLERVAHRFPNLVRFPTVEAAPLDGGPDRAVDEGQARRVRRQIQALRRLKYRPTGGFVASFPTSAHDLVGEACRPVVVVADRLPARVVPGQPLALDVHVVSDRRTELSGTVEAELRWSGGAHRWTFAGEVPADACVRVGTLQLEVPDAPGELVLSLRGRIGDQDTESEDVATIG